jgi:hypothetical protein
MMNIPIVSILIILVLLSVVGCDQRSGKQAQIIDPASQLSRPISLKDLTTGAKAGQAIKDGYLGRWSYFGKQRVVQTEQLADGTIATITILMDGGDAFSLRNELEAKYSKEEGHVVRFDCRMTDRRLPMLDDAKVWDTDCTLRHANQILTVHEVSPNDVNLIRDRYSLRAFFFTSNVTLVDTDLVAENKAAIAKKEADAQKRELDKAKQDL